ncbi:hypothetical protein FACS1894120_0400 [Clostridia bacterium]|nr:hypothetical protein FACS1894120_0400 [Clostridia bacterium]
MKTTTKNKSMVGIVSIIIVVAMLLMAIVSAVSIYTLSITDAAKELKLSTDALSNKVDGYIEKVKVSVSQNSVVGKQFFDEDRKLAKERFLGYLTTIYNNSGGEYSDCYAGFVDGDAVFGMGWVPPADYDVTTRGWYKNGLANPGKIIVDAPYYDLSYNTLSLAFTKSIGDSTEYGTTCVDVFLASAEKMVDDANSNSDAEAIVIGSNGDVYITDDELLKPDGTTGEFVNLEKLGGDYAKMYKGVTEGAGNPGGKTFSLGGYYYTSTVMPSTNWYIVSKIPSAKVLSPVIASISVMGLLFVVCLAVSVLLLRSVVKRVVTTPINKIRHIADKVTQGEINVEIPSNFIGEVGMLAESFANMIDSIKHQSDVLRDVSGGNYTHTINLRSENDVLGNSINNMVVTMNDTLHTIHGITADVANHANGIANMSGQLSQTTSEESATVEEITASMADISTKTQSNTDMAKEAASLSGNIKHNAEKGSAQMSEMTKAVDEINGASRNISKVIKVIDDIAFQTNILALNAAVEAARAGEAGKGFAVVADEVRNLASKSAAAAKETGELIENSMKKAEIGSQIANETALSLTDIVSGINESTLLIGKIAESSEEQNQAIAQIGSAVQQVADVVSRNAATAQESAAFSDELNGLSVRLEQQLKSFKLK